MRGGAFLWGVLLGCICMAAASPGLAADVMPAKFRLEPVVRGVDRPEGIALAPDGRVFLLERLTGKVLVLQFGSLLADPLLQLTVASGSEEGLLGIAVDPNFTSNHYVYLYYTQASPKTNRLVRYTADGNRASGGVVLLDNIGSGPGGNNGGALMFGQDGKLYVGVGDMESSSDAQSLSSLKGKVLRINPDGTVPSDNPHLGQPYPYNLIFAQGFRNSDDLAFHAQAGTIYGTDNYDSQATCDEINVIRAGLNYGWPTATCDNAGFQRPLHTITPQITPSGLASYRGGKYPGMEDNLFVAGTGKIIRDTLSGANFDTWSATADFYLPSGECPVALRDLEPGKDGWLYALSADTGTNKAGLYRVIYQEMGGPSAKPREVSATPYIPLMLAKDGSGLRLWWEDLKKSAWNCSPPTENQWKAADPAQSHCPVSWTTGAKYTVWQGDLQQPFGYSHTKLAENDGDGTQQNDARRSYRMASMPAGNRYYLISARGANLEGSLGQASNGTERPGNSATESDRCNLVGWASDQIPPPANPPMWNRCGSDWPHPYPDQNGVLHTFSEFRGKAVFLTFMQFG